MGFEKFKEKPTFEDERKKAIDEQAEKVRTLQGLCEAGNENACEQFRAAKERELALRGL